MVILPQLVKVVTSTNDVKVVTISIVAIMKAKNRLVIDDASCFWLWQQRDEIGCSKLDWFICLLFETIYGLFFRYKWKSAILRLKLSATVWRSVPSFIVWTELIRLTRLKALMCWHPLTNVVSISQWHVHSWVQLLVCQEWKINKTKIFPKINKTIFVLIPSFIISKK